MGEGFTAALSMIGTLLLMVAVFVGAYYVSRYIGKKHQTGGASSGSIRILDRIALGREQSLLLVRAGEKVLLLSCTGRSIEKLDELDADLFPENDGNRMDHEQLVNTWKNILKTHGENVENPENGKGEQL